MQVLTFTTNNTRYAVPIDLVDTIESRLPLTPIPKSRKTILGLASVRGTVVPVVSAGLILGGIEPETYEKLIVVKFGNEKYAFAVEDVDDVIDINEEDVQMVNQYKDLSVIQFGDELLYLLTSSIVSHI